MITNRRIVLARHPEGRAALDDLRLEEVPARPPEEGEVLCRTIWLSLDPYMRGRMSTAASYAAHVEIGQPIHGEAVCEVIESRHPGFSPGDVVAGAQAASQAFGWQSHPTIRGDMLRKLDPSMERYSYALGVLGMPGLTAYAALKGIGKPKPGETVVIGAATGAVGMVAARTARSMGARAIGIAGGADKCQEAVERFGYEICLDRHEPDLIGRLKQACPNGVQVYLELTGGQVTDAVWPLLTTHARVPVVGLIAGYQGSSIVDGPDRLPLFFRQILVKRLHIQGMIVWDWAYMEDDFRREVGGWLRDGTLQYREDIVEGLENAPAAFLGMLEGKNHGKLLVKVGPEPRKR
jgi:NADPH-dependent curcumin reductase CurA